MTQSCLTGLPCAQKKRTMRGQHAFTLARRRKYPVAKKTIQAGTIHPFTDAADFGLYTQRNEADQVGMLKKTAIGADQWRSQSYGSTFDDGTIPKLRSFFVKFFDQIM